MKVFISYSTESSLLAEELSTILQGLHPPNVVVGIMRNIPYGSEWTTEVEQRLDAADVLIAVAAGAPREEFAYTGVEIGYFLNSIRQRPEGETGAKRCIIPIFLTSNPPDVLGRAQGPNFGNYLLSVAGYDPSKPSREIAEQLPIDENDPAYLLLAALEAIAAPASPVNNARKAELVKQARSLYRVVIDVLRAQPVSEEQLKSRLILHLPAQSWDVGDSTLEAEGPIFQRLNLGNMPITWAKIADSLKPSGLGDEWREAIHTLLRAVRGDELEKADQLVSSPKGTDTVLARMFVSRSVRYHSGRRDVHIYVVRLHRDRDYGDPFTTTLWQGIGSCIRLRFLLLEQHESFSSLVIRTHVKGGADRVREYARELKTELYAAERQWRMAGLDDPVKLLRILRIEGDPESITKMTEVWQKQRDELVAATAAVISSNDSEMEVTAEQWIKSLDEFRLKISAFNAQFILQMLDQLKQAVEEAASDDAGMSVSDRAKVRRKRKPSSRQTETNQIKKGKIWQTKK